MSTIDETGCLKKKSSPRENRPRVSAAPCTVPSAPIRVSLFCRLLQLLSVAPCSTRYNIYIKERLEGLVGDKVDGTINTRMAAAAKSWKDLPEHVKAIYAGKAAKAAGQ